MRNVSKSVLSIILVILTVLNSVIINVYADEYIGGICVHHTEHTEECGFNALNEEVQCRHEHRDECYIIDEKCVHEHINECYKEILACLNEENHEHKYECYEKELICEHICSEESGCVKKELNCKHEHDDECGYSEKTEGLQCNFVCDICYKANELDNTKTEETENSDLETNENINNSMNNINDANNIIGVITNWSYTENDIIVNEDGKDFVIIEDANEENLYYIENVIDILPKSIEAETESGNKIFVINWICDYFPQDGDYEGSFVFEAELTENYYFSEDTKKPEINLVFAEKTDLFSVNLNRDVEQVEYDYDEYSLYANGIPILIKEDEYDALKIRVYNADGSPISGISNIAFDYPDNVYGGCRDVMGTATGDTTIIIESGVIGNTVFGGDKNGNRTGDTNVILKGGTVSYIVGGSENGNISGNTNIEVSGTAHINNNIIGGCIYGGAKSSRIIFNGEKVGCIYGGSSIEGKVDKTYVEVNGGHFEYTYDDGEKDVTALGEIYGGGYNAPVGDTEVVVTGGDWSIVSGGGVNGTAGNTDITIFGGENKKSFVYGGGFNAGATVENTNIKLIKGSCMSQVYGAGYNGNVMGNVNIDLKNICTGTTEPIWIFGGSASQGVVQGDVNITYDPQEALYTNKAVKIIGDGNNNYYGGNSCVNGNKTLTLKQVKTINGNKESYLPMVDICNNFDTLVVDDSIIQFFSLADGLNRYFPKKNVELKGNTKFYVSKEAMEIENDIILNGGSIILQDNGNIKVNGNVIYKSEITDVTVENDTMESKIKLMTGNYIDVSKFNITNEGYTLVKEGNDIYAVKLEDVNVDMYFDKDEYYYKDTVKVNVSLPKDSNITTNGKVTLKMDYNMEEYMFEPGYILPGEQTKNINLNGEVEFLIPLDTSGSFKVTASFTEGSKTGTVSRELTVNKRKLKIKEGTVTGGSKEYDGTLSASKVDFTNAIVEGYLPGDGGMVIDIDNDICNSYCFNSVDVGEGKKITTAYTMVYTKYYRNEILTDEQKKANLMYYRYIIEPPILKADITRKKFTGAIFQEGVSIKARAGALLSSVTLNFDTFGDYRWVNPNEKITMDKSEYNAVFVPKDTKNYDYSGVEGWNDEKQVVEGYINIIAEKGEAPSNKTVIKNCGIKSGKKNIDIDLSSINPFDGLDAGNITYEYLGDTTAENITNIAFESSAKKLTFTLDNVENTVDEMAVISIKVNSDNFASAYINVIISMVDKQVVDISGLNIKTKVYDGKPIEILGKPVVEGGYTGELEYVWSNGSVPVDAGSYTLTVKVPDSDTKYVGSIVMDFYIKRKEVIIKPKDTVCYIGNDMPNILVEYLGLVEGESIEPVNEPTFIFADINGVKIDNIVDYGKYKIMFDTKPLFNTNEGVGKNYTLLFGEGELKAEKDTKPPIDNKQSIDISGLYVENKVYDGKPVKVLGDAVVTGGYTGDLEYIWSNGFAPSNAGEYTLTIRVPESNTKYTGSITLSFNIEKRELKVKPSDVKYRIKKDMPKMSIEYIGLVEGENIMPYNKPTFAFIDSKGIKVESITKTGTYKIVFDTKPMFDIDGISKNYTILFDYGILKATKSSSYSDDSQNDGRDGNEIYKYGEDSSHKSNIKTKYDTTTLNVEGSVLRDDVDRAIEQAIENNSKNIVIKGTNNKFALPIGAAGYIGNKTKADLVIETNFGNVTIPNNVLSQFKSDERVSIAIENNKIVVLSNEKELSDFGSIVVKIPYYKNENTGNVAVEITKLDNTKAIIQNVYSGGENIVFTIYGTVYYTIIDNYTVANDNNPFVDINTHWAKNDILKAFNYGLFSGIDERNFGPELITTRGMLAAIIYRMDGGKNTDSSNVFVDVLDDMYYADGVAWGNKNNIISGYDDGLFRPEELITREQLALLLYKYSLYKNFDNGKTDDYYVERFYDYNEISDWAKTAVCYCVEQGIISGRTDGSIDPKGKATRAEVASMLVRFLEKTN